MQFKKTRGILKQNPPPRPLSSEDIVVLNKSHARIKLTRKNIFSKTELHLTTENTFKLASRLTGLSADQVPMYWLGLAHNFTATVQIQIPLYVQT